MRCLQACLAGSVQCEHESCVGHVHFDINFLSWPKKSICNGSGTTFESAMEALTELCDLVAQNPTQFADKLAWICGRCPPSESLHSRSPRVSRSQLNAVLAVARFLSKCRDPPDHHPNSLILDFLLSIPDSFQRSFWPQSFSSDSITEFFVEFLGYVSKAAELSPDFAEDIAGFAGEVVMAAINYAGEDLTISRVFLSALSQNSLPVLPEDADRLVACLLDQCSVSVPPSPRDQIAVNSETSSCQSSPLPNESASPINEVSQSSGSSKGSSVSNGGSILWKTGGDASFGFNGGAGEVGGVLLRQQIASFEEESVENLGKQELAFKLIAHILDKVRIDPQLLDQVRLIVKKQLQSMPPFLRIRKRDWNEQGPLLKSRINAKLAVSQAAAKMKIKCLASLEVDARTSKRLVLETLALLIDVAEACLFSGWRKLRICEELFRSLLSGSAKIAVSRGGEPLRIFLIHLKRLVLTSCLPADTWGSSQEAMFESVLDTCCEIVVSGWTRDRAPLVTFINGLASGIRERNDYEEQVDKEKQAVQFMQRNLIRLLAELNVVVKKPEVVDMILPPFIESLEEGDASIPSLLRLRLLDAVSRVASLGFEKSYRETVVLMTRNYLSRLSTVGSAESKTLAPEATSERVEPSAKAISSNLNSIGSMGTISLQAVGGPYMWNTQWSSAVQRIAQGTPPLVVSTVKWLEDELELNALHNPGSRRASGNEKAALAQKAALSAALGGKVDVAAMTTISGVKATYLLAVAFLEIIRFSSNGGILNGDTSVTDSRSAFSCVFEYLKTSDLTPAVLHCLTAIVHRSFETAVLWLEDRITETGNEAEVRESTLFAHACFLIKSMLHRQDLIRETAVNLLTQLRSRFPQILWNSSCLDSLLFLVHNDVSSAVINDPARIATIRRSYERIVREWIILSLSYAPCTSQGLLQEKICKANTWQRAPNTTDVVSLLSEIRNGTSKNDCWTGTRTANIPAVMAAAAAASGGNLELTEAFNMELLSTAIVSATVKCNIAGQIDGMRKVYDIQSNATPTGSAIGSGIQRLISGAFSQPTQAKDDSFNKVLLNNFVRLLQQFVYTAEKGGKVDKSQFRETCSQATALLLSDLGSDSRSNIEDFAQLLRLLCWCPAYISTPDAMETGIFIWTWLVSAAPQLGSIVLAELVDAWLWTIDTKRGLFASDVKYSGPAAKLRPHLAPGEPEPQPEFDPVEQILAHRLWLGFFMDRFEVVRHNSVEQLLLLARMLQGTTNFPWKFSHHPGATGTFLTVMLLGLKFCSCHSQGNLQKFKTGLQLLEDRIYRASLGWFAYEPGWCDLDNMNSAQSEAQSVAIFVHYLTNDRGDTSQSDSKGCGRENGSSLVDVSDQYHPVWGQMENYALGREKRKQLLLMLCQHEADRLEVWAQPTNTKDVSSRPKISLDKWVEYARTAFSVDPRVALSLASRFPANATLKAELTILVQTHISEIHSVPEALPYFVTPKAVDENSVLLQQLPHWAACSITQALEFLTPAYKGHPRVMAYVLRVLESYPPEWVTFFMPQLVQALRYDEGRLVEGYLLRAAKRSDIFAHILIWHLQGETVPESGKDAGIGKNSSFQEQLPIVRQRIIDGFSYTALDLFRREFDFFDKVTSISGVLYPLPKEERRAGIRRELEKIEMEGEDLYVPTAPNKLVRGIQVDSGIPLQSAAKVPIMITFDVVDKDGDHNDITPQACIFKVGDDCRQDVLALQVISLLRDIFEAVGLKLYLFPYGVLPTGPERGIVEVVPNVRSRSQMGETTDGGLFEIFQQDYGPVGSPSFEAARENFIISSAGYAVASLLLQPKDRHNGNLLFDNVGRLVHIDFGFIFEISPGGNMRFESAHFKLSHEMTQLLDPSGVTKSDTWNQFVSLCVKGYLAARRYMDGIVNTVSLMLDSGLPCFGRGDPIGNLRKRFHPEMTEREAANFMIRVCTDAYNKWTTAGYDLIQYLQQGIEK
ncbi:putative phosphatidylinositol 4-kinase [Tripterygium wilfordii]|uniref:1-phosphatidylinositol 4-kinase n=1 Tax=Tripterygium wilfordii TaxID=458696 RepID=A0A7J7DH64_TRIWF|nr:putative phosphatidylinositol 4-kinase [Tripterygium wilfordii]